MARAALPLRGNVCAQHRNAMSRSSWRFGAYVKVPQVTVTAHACGVYTGRLTCNMRIGLHWRMLHRAARVGQPSCIKVV